MQKRINLHPVRRNLSYYWSLFPALLAIAGNLLGGWFTAGNFLFSFGILAILDTFLGTNTSNTKGHSTDKLPKVLLYLQLPVQTAVLISLLILSSHSDFGQPWIYLAILSSGASGGAGGIVSAHELIHKASPKSRMAGKYLLALCGNFYFYIHHLRIHHRWVATSRDAATARRNENVYAFFVRTVIGQCTEAWQSEKSLLQKKNKPAIHWSNQILQSILLLIFFEIAFLYLFGIAGMLVYLAFCIVSNFLLEYVNYIEHYGLQRADTDNIGAWHSWNCDRKISRFFLIDLSRHTDHHLHAAKHYHLLDSIAEAPQLPGGYVSLIYFALIPPLWRRHVHPHLDALPAETFIKPSGF